MPVPLNLPGAIVPPRPTTPPPVPPVAPRPPVPAPTGEVRTMAADIGRMSTGQTPASVPPARLAPTPAPTPTGAIPVTVPPASGTSGKDRRLLFLLVGGIALIILIYLIISLMGGGQEPQESPTPSPTAQASATPAAKKLESYFPQAGSAIELKSADTAKLDFLNALHTAQPPVSGATRIVITGTVASLLPNFLESTSGALPQNIKDALAGDWAVLAYGQKEQFDTNGQPVANADMRTRLVVLGELKDASGASQAMMQWEQNGLVSKMGGLFGVDPTEAIIKEFSSGTYRQATLHYQNFPYADTSLDWSVATASNNKNYLVITGSREAIFFAIDQLMQ